MEKAHQIKHAQFVTKRERHDGGEVRDKICSDTFFEVGARTHRWAIHQHIVDVFNFFSWPQTPPFS